MTENFMDWPEMFSPSYMAVRIGISKSSSYRITAKDGLARQIGGRLVINKSDFIVWFESKRIKPITEKITTKNKSEICKPIKRRST